MLGNWRGTMDLLGKFTLQIHNVQHREWSIVGFLSHIHIPPTKENITFQVEALDIFCDALGIHARRW